MTARKCQKCGKTNPVFFTHCIFCGSKLEEDTKKTILVSDKLKTGLVIGISIILIFVVISLTARVSISYGQNFSEAVLALPAVDLQNASEFRLNQPVGNNDIQIMVNSARDGQNIYGSNKFFLVSVSLKNIRTDRNFRVSNNDFELIDSEGIKYQPYGVGSHVTVDISPLQGSTDELTFVIPQDAVGERIRFTFPETSTLMGHRDVVVFVI